MWDPAKFHGGEAAASRAFDRSNPARYAPKAGRASAPPKHFERTDRAPDLAATATKAYAESERRGLAASRPDFSPKKVRAKTERTARG